MDSINSPIPTSSETLTPASLLPPLPSVPTDKAMPRLATKSGSTGGGKFLRVFFFLLLAIGALAVPSYFVWTQNINTQNKAKESSITVASTNTDVKATLAKEFIYTADGENTYYSPSLDATFIYDKSLLYTNEGSTSVSLVSRKFTEIYADLVTLPLTKTPEVYYKDRYGTYEKYTQTETKKEAAYSTFSFSYQQDQLLNKGTKQQVSVVVYYKKFDTEKQYATIKVQNYGASALPEVLTAQYINILTTLNLKPENVAATISAPITDMDAAISFDKKLWTVSTQTENYLSLSLLTKNYTDPSIFIGIQQVYFKQEQKAEVLEKALSDEIDYSKKEHTDVKIITPTKKITLAKADAYTTTYSYTSIGSHIVKTMYAGFIPNEGGYYTITVSKYFDDTAKTETTAFDTEIDKVINSFAFGNTPISMVNTVSSKVLGESTLTIDSPAIIGKVGTVHIANTMCTDLVINDPKVLPLLSKKKYSGCSSATGSGFFVTEDGYIVTNAHVAADSPFANSTDMFLSDEGTVFKAISNEIADRLLEQDPYFFSTKEAEDEFAAKVKVYIVQLIGQKKITFTNTVIKNYMENGTPFEYDESTGKIKNTAALKELEVVKANSLESYIEYLGKLYVEGKDMESNPYTYKVADLAVLKVKDPTQKYPALSLANADLLIDGSPLYAIGFPGAADNRYMFSANSSLSATITKGTISAVKTSASNNYKLIQTDATINHGNSGGPMVNEQAKVIGVSTYSLDASTGNYNAGILVEEVQKILAEANVTPAQGSVITSLNSGIDNFKKEYYTWAIRDFKTVTSEYPATTALMQPFILLAQESINNGKDNTPLLEISGYFIHKTELPYIFGGLGVALIALILMIVALFKKNGRRGTPPTKTELPQTPPTLTSATTASFVQTTPNTMQNNVPSPMAPQSSVPEKVQSSPMGTSPLAGIDLTPFAVKQSVPQPEITSVPSPVTDILPSLPPLPQVEPVLSQPLATTPSISSQAPVVPMPTIQSSAAVETPMIQMQSQPVAAPIITPPPVALPQGNAFTSPAVSPPIPQPVQVPVQPLMQPPIAQPVSSGPSFVNTPSQQGTSWTPPVTNSIPTLP